MAQGTLSAADVVQAKTRIVTTAATSTEVFLDAATQAGSTVTIELYAAGNPITDVGTGIPAGFEEDATGVVGGTAIKSLLAYRKRDVAAGEGIAGSTGWTFTDPYGTAHAWYWRATEWSRSLEPVFPLERSASTGQTGTTPTAISTGTTPDTQRPNAVALAWHHWQRPSNTAETFDFSDHTNGFTERDEQRFTVGAAEGDVCWSWKFLDTTGPVECTATINLATRNAADSYAGFVVVYAATTYA